MDASSALAHSVANIRFDDIPAEAIRVAKMSLLDTLGVTTAASTLGRGCREVVECVKEGGGKEESTILGFGGKAPSYMAALANGMMAHALDYDDIHEASSIHAGAVIVPAALAVAERAGKVNGKEFITAVVLGVEVGCRLSLAAAPRVSGFHPTPVFGFFGAAAGAGRILGLDEARVQNALGIAYSQAAGNRQSVSDAALTERLEVGFAAKGGVLSALLAEKGITGAMNSLEGEFGFYKVYNGGKYKPEVLLSNLGTRFEVSNLSFKPYPCGRSQHASIDATLEMVREYDIQAGDVERITVFKSQMAVKGVGVPADRKRRPENPVDAQFSIPYTTATAVVRRKVDLRDFTPEAIRDPAVLQVAQKVDVEVCPEFEPSNYHPGITEIRTKGGKTYSRRVEEPHGNPHHPIPEGEMIEKFMECASHAMRPLSKEDVSRVIEMVMKLEELDDVGAISRLLAR
ncbi:MAG: MmgE/PrpD family protein [Chloroflexi bacterium]|nr:MmgE/PrpD family protein [Chloroflexota bacterium]